MKAEGRCQSCGKASYGKSKCRQCKPISKQYKRKHIKRHKSAVPKKPKHSAWSTSKPVKLSTPAELLSRLTMTEQYQENDMTEAWRK